jgi:hypothetical protein
MSTTEQRYAPLDRLEAAVVALDCGSFGHDRAFAEFRPAIEAAMDGYTSDEMVQHAEAIASARAINLIEGLRDFTHDWLVRAHGVCDHAAIYAECLRFAYDYTVRYDEAIKSADQSFAANRPAS